MHTFAVGAEGESPWPAEPGARTARSVQQPTVL